MTIDEITEIIEADIIINHAPEVVVLRACACDMLSDVLRCVSEEKSILLTNLTHAQTVRVAEMVDATAVCFMRGKMPMDDAVRLAQEEGIVLLSTELSTYEAAGRLYNSGLPGCCHE
jgi:predicted transcriptional regulator